VTVSLSRAQEEMLRYLVRQEGRVPADHLDGRSLRVLLARGLVTRQSGWVTPTESGRAHLEQHTARERDARRRRAGSGQSSARAEAVLRAADEIELALPKGAELMVGGVPVYGDDVVAGIRRYARETMRDDTTV
jgi:hypothetical protein